MTRRTDRDQLWYPFDQFWYNLQQQRQSGKLELNGLLEKANILGWNMPSAQDTQMQAARSLPSIEKGG